MTYFCITDHKSICAKCMLKHNGHNVVKSKEMIGDITAELSQICASFTGERERIQNLFEVKQIEVGEIEEAKNREFEMLDARMSQLHAQLDDMKQQLKSQFIEEFYTPMLEQIKGANKLLQDEIGLLDNHIKYLSVYAATTDTTTLDYYYQTIDEFASITHRIDEDKVGYSLDLDLFKQRIPHFQVSELEMTGLASMAPVLGEIVGFAAAHPPEVTLIDVDKNCTFAYNALCVGNNTDFKIVSPGEVLTIEFKLKNVGRARWPKQTALKCINQEAKNKVHSTVPVIDPEEQIIVCLRVIAPSTPGEYDYIFKMFDLDKEVFFGQEFSVYF